ncbi:hypothetical protein [Hymenobacter sp. BRD67]|uniref:hypothetical protein n=1 Tax=Hymenobacter sp. BRD67 TaxID=2675877 RepID=UPI0015659CEC|nr:hypothetical protein [Hymenobacter sp. BRD67]QKG54241.1 hypothetical protein GKZ67_18630 [Hymenobacter sp. BRD67]
MSTPATVRQANLDQRNLRIRDAFYKRFTNVPRAQRPERELVVAQLAGEYFLSAKPVELIVMPKARQCLR